MIEDELADCESFAISVAFVTNSGLQQLLSVLKELAEKGTPGRILTADYLCFSEPIALRRLMGLKNIQVKLFRCPSAEGFHTKGYIFRNRDLCRILLGSSNLTAKALTTNREWNARIVSKETGEFAAHLLGEFELLWNRPESLDLSIVIDEYEAEWGRRRAALRKIEPELVKRDPTLQPNNMQREFIANLKTLYKSGAKRAMLISATGTGKTYASAFAVRELKPKRVLFLVHREQIARQAKKSYGKVLGEDYTYGMLTGNECDDGQSCVFATVQTLSKPEHLRAFREDDFELIVVDEVHHASADSYQRVMDYFSPRLWLGMTGSPDRPDGQNIYKLFDNNIVYEIRLQTALEENLLCPFHYYGISDVSASGHLTDNVRVEHILEHAAFYGYSGDRVRGLVFCSTVEECRRLAEAFIEKGHPSEVVTCKDKPETRRAVIDRLTQKEGPDHVEYVFTVDVFNEGVDIPEVNQVILLRPTESAIVFIRQLGRGLRKCKDKEFVVILDFIGNYRSSFLIPVALSGDNSYNKDNMRRFMEVERRHLPGQSTISFDHISRERIFKAIDDAHTDSIRLFSESYQRLRRKLGRIPRLTDFDQHNEIDAAKFFAKNVRTYPAFLEKYEKGYTVRFDETAKVVLRFLSNRIGCGMRLSEAIVLETLLNTPVNTVVDLKADLIEKLTAARRSSPTEAHLKNVFAVLSNGFSATKEERERQKRCVFIKELGNAWYPSPVFLQILKTNPGLREAVLDLTAFVRQRWERDYAERYSDTDLVLYRKYEYDDVCRLLDWKKAQIPQNMGGHFYDSDSKTFVVFINYHKVEGAISYEDRFLSSRELIALSKLDRKPTSKDADHIYKRTPADADNRIFLFMRRSSKEKSSAFYFLGEVNAQGEPNPVMIDRGDEKRKSHAFEILYRLETPVRSDIYEYLTGK